MLVQSLAEGTAIVKRILQVVLVLSSVFLALCLCYYLLLPLTFPSDPSMPSQDPLHFVLKPLYRWQATQDAKHDGRPQVLPTPSPYPRLEEKQARERITELFKTNGGCRFPCWWGIVPGKTSWQEANAILEPLVPNSSVMRYLDDDGVRLYVDGSYGGRGFGTDVMIYGNQYTPVTEIKTIDIQPEYLSNLTLSKIFKSYGMPGGIYIRNPYHVNSSGVDNFDLYIHYPSDGFAVRYVYKGYTPFTTIQVCGLDQPAFADFDVGELSVASDIRKVSAIADWYWDDELIKPLDVQTTWTIETFYKAIVSPDGQTVCIESRPLDEVENR